MKSIKSYYMKHKLTRISMYSRGNLSHKKGGTEVHIYYLRRIRNVLYLHTFPNKIIKSDLRKLTNMEVNEYIFNISFVKAFSWPESTLISVLRAWLALVDCFSYCNIRPPLRRPSSVVE